MIFVRKLKFPNFNYICPKMPEFFMTFARKIFSRNLGGRAPLPSPVSYAYRALPLHQIARKISQKLPSVTLPNPCSLEWYYGIQEKGGKGEIRMKGEQDYRNDGRWQRKRRVEKGRDVEGMEGVRQNLVHLTISRYATVSEVVYSTRHLLKQRMKHIANCLQV